jgi:hypothetical protein
MYSCWIYEEISALKRFLGNTATATQAANLTYLMYFIKLSSKRAAVGIHTIQRY